MEVRPVEGAWGVAIVGAGLASALSPRPVAITVEGASVDRPITAGYRRIESTRNGVVGRATVAVPGGGELSVVDRWRVGDDALELSRRIDVTRGAAGGFGSGVTFAPTMRLSRSDVGFFAPGMIYGGPERLTAGAIGGAAVYRSGTGAAWIREDRLPAPLFAASFRDGSSLAVLDPAPRGDTSPADAADVVGTSITDARLRFGAVGSTLENGRLEIGFRFPGTEGEVTYRGDTYPGGQERRWRRRFHPLRQGFTQEYRVRFRIGRGDSFPAFIRRNWRWAWRTLAPQVAMQDVDAARRALVDLLAARTETVGGRTGIAQFTPAPAGAAQAALPRQRRANMGFVGKNLEAAEFMLAEASRRPGPDGTRLRALAGRIVDSFVRLPMSPPVGEGFHLDTGEPSLFAEPGHEQVVYLRPLADDMKGLLRAIRRERAGGREHPGWLAWSRRFGDWLLTQQRPDGGFPRAWRPGTGEVAVGSPASSYNPVPFLVLLSELTRDRRYLLAATRAGEFSWRLTGGGGVFAGGTIDNPDVVDKEAGTLSLEAYLALFEATRDRRWLDRARAAADYAETWIYLWDVPMPPDADPAALHWKPGIPTTGAQLIATGHSLADQYMAFDVDEYAKLYCLTSDPHYRDVARLLLHNTKTMLALPGRAYDLKGPGWQQEHWSFAPRRGRGLHRGWLPWVATSQLNGIYGLMEFDPALYRELASQVERSSGSPGRD